MKIEGIINADGTSQVLVGATPLPRTGGGGPGPGVGVYSFTLQYVCPLARRRARAELIWNGGVSNGLVVQYAAAYSTDTVATFIVSSPGNPGTKVDAAFSFCIESIP